MPLPRVSTPSIKHSSTSSTPSTPRCPTNTKTVLACPPFAWGVNECGIWKAELPLLTLHAISDAIGELTDEQRRALATTYRFQLHFYTAAERAAFDVACGVADVRVV